MISRTCLIVLLLLPIVTLSQPNVLWLTIEDTSPQFIGAYGNTAASTPNMDLLAREGVTFTNAFSTGAVCSPSRYTIITGTRTGHYGTGHHRSRYDIPDMVQGFPAYLKTAGIHTSNNSKTDYNTSDAGRLIRDSWNENSPQAGWRNRNAGQRFFSVVNFISSHQSRTMTNPWEVYEDQVISKLSKDEIIDPADIILPAFVPDNRAMRKEFSRIYNSLKLTDKEIGWVLDSLRRDGLMEETIIFLYSDHGQGMIRGKTNAIGLGHRVPFVIWFPEKYKNLSPWKPGSTTDELITFEDLAPTMLSFFGIPIPEYMTGRPFLGPQRQEPSPHKFTAVDRSGAAIELSRSVTDGRYIYTRVFMPHVSEMRYQKYHEYAAMKRLYRSYYENGSLNEENQKYFEHRQPEYLYDLEKDTWETRNLVHDPRHSDLVDQFRSALEKDLLETIDVHFMPEYQMDSIDRSVPLNEWVKKTFSGKEYKNIIRMALLTGKGSHVLKTQIDSLSSANAVIRYWAALGLKSQGHQELRGYKKALRNALNDPYPPVAIEIAGLGYEVLGLAPFRNTLMKWASNQKNNLLALEALQNIIWLEKDRLKPFLKVAESQYLKHRDNGQWLNVADMAEMILHKATGRPLHYEHFW